MSYDTEYRLRRAIRNGDEDIVEEIIRRVGNWVGFDKVREIFEDERRGRIGNFGDHIEFGEIEIHDHFGNPQVRRK
jgi:hypothetical protein